MAAEPVSLAQLIEAIIESLDLSNAATLQGHAASYFGTDADSDANAAAIAAHIALTQSAHGGIVAWDSYGARLTSGEYLGVDGSTNTITPVAGTIYGRPVAVAKGGAINNTTGSTRPRIRVATLDSGATAYAALYTKPNLAVQSWTKLTDLGSTATTSTGTKNLEGPTIVDLPDRTVVWFMVGVLSCTTLLLNALEGTTNLLPKAASQTAPLSALTWTGFSDGSSGMPSTLGAPFATTPPNPDGNQRMPSVLVKGA